MGTAEDDKERPQADEAFPEGGLKAWATVAGAFCVLFCTFGYLNAFGVYQEYYQTHQLSNESSSTISWIGSLQVFFLYAGGAIGGPLFDRYGGIVTLPPITLYIVDQMKKGSPIADGAQTILPPAILLVFAVMMTSLSKEYYQFILAQGILGGICCGMMFAPAMAAVGHYFKARRALAMGIAVSGSSFGGVIYPIALGNLFEIPSIAFGWGVRIVGFIILALLAIGCATLRSRLPSRRGNVLVLSAFRDINYILTIVSLFFLIWGMFTPFFYIESYARYSGMSPNLASYMLSILNAASIFGRICPGFAADRFGNFVLLFCSGICTGILLLCWIAIKSNAAIIVFAALYGFFSGAIVSLLSPCLAQIAPHPSLIGAYLGMALLLVGLAGLTGTPICGALIDHYGWTAAKAFSGAVVFVGAGFVLVTHFSLRRRR